MANYEQRLVLFIDFLGFRAAVDRTVSEPEFLDRLINALDSIGKIGLDLDLDSQRMTQFSDSVVLSYRIEEESAVFWLLNSIAFCVIELVERGFLLRGAVTIGDLLHNERHVVGPAMVRAYEMESREAIFPRVIVDPDVLAIARSATAEHHSEDDEEQYVRDFLSEDTDGRLFFDYISWTTVVAVTGGENDLYPTYLAKLAALLRGGLNNDNPGVLKKYLWLFDHYIRAISGFDDLPGDHPYVIENPEVVEDVRGLPRFKAEAAHARTRV